MLRAAEAVQSGAKTARAVVSAEVDDHYLAMVDRHYAPLLRYLTRQTGDADLAADLTQEAFMAAYRRYGQLNDRAAFAAWLYQIARNQLRMEFRQRRLRHLISLDWLSGRGDGGIPEFGQPDAVVPTGDRDEIQRVLDLLSPVLREALLLHGLCGFSGGEVATILGITPAAARKRICRAEAEFRTRYRAKGDGADVLL